MRELLPTHRLTDFPLMSPELIDRFRGLGGPAIRMPRHAVIRSEGSSDRSVYLLVEGWVVASLLMREGERQIVKLHLPGDMLGSTSMCLDTAIDTLTALTPVVVRRVPLEELGALMAEAPAVAMVMLLSAQKERIALMDRLAAVARSNATARIAAFLLDLNERLAAVGQSIDDTFEMRITQEQMGDLLGLTSVHVNRMLRRMAVDSLIERRGATLRLADLEGLRRTAAIPPRAMSRDLTWLDASTATSPQEAPAGPLRR